MPRHIFCALFVGITCGCAPVISGTMNATVTEEEINTKTMAYFAAAPEDIRIENIESHTLATTFRTYHKDVLYNCRIYYGSVECKQPGA